jgi:hypothetical protein
VTLIQEKMKEIVSIIPISLVILILNFTITPLSQRVLIQFIIGIVFLVIGLPIFLLGIDIAISSIGDHISEALVKSNKLWLVLIGGGFLGFIVTIAEPDLQILASQVNLITSGHFNSQLMVVLVSLGMGALVLVGLFKIIKNISLKWLMAAIYLLILILGLFTQPDFLAIAFDASGCTTGSISVPFILALSTGISSMTRSNEKEENDGFGILGVASTGAIIAVLLQGLITGTGPITGTLPTEEAATGGMVQQLLLYLVQTAKESLVILLPIIVVFLIMNIFWIKLSKPALKRIAIGCIYTYIGLIFFLIGVNYGLIEASSQVGYQLAAQNKQWLLILVGAVFGLITIPAEPSVHVLTRQIEDETAGSIKATIVMFALCAGVAVAVGLSILRILFPGIQLWHILLPGMIIAIVLSFIVPDIFVGIAYDSGGVAAGTMTAAVILPFAHGVAEYIPSASIVQDGFGVIAIVAMTPLIAVQLVGLIYKIKSGSVMIEVFELEEEEASDVE